jgi:hypothetical protein
MKVARFFAAGLAAAAFLALTAYSQFRGLTDSAAMDYAQGARCLSEGRGFVSRVVRPIHFWYFAEHGKPAPQPGLVPELRREPAWPAVLAAGMKLVRPSFDVPPRFRFFAPERQVVLPLSILFSLGTGWLIFLMGRRLFDERVAGVGTAAYFLSHVVLVENISGLPAAMATFLATAACYAAVAGAMKWGEENNPAGGLFLFGASAALCALGVLTRYGLVVLVPGLALFLGLTAPRHRWLIFAGFLLIFAACISLWIIRNLRVGGTLFGLVPLTALDGSTACAPGCLERSLAMKLDNSEIVAAVTGKFLANIGRVLETDIWTPGNALFICFFLVSFFYRFLRDDVHLLRWCMALALALAVAAAAVFGDGTARLFDVFLPFVILYGTAFFFLTLDRLDLRDAAATGLVVGVLLASAFVPTGLAMLGGGEKRPYPPYSPPCISTITEYLKQDEVLCTDLPEATAWYGGQTSLLLPRSVDDFRQIHEHRLRISGLYLTTRTSNRPYAADLVQGAERSWLVLLNGDIPAEFPLTDGLALPPGTREGLFLTDFSRFAH